MSLLDGQQREDLYTTSDIAFAAYLIARGYELLGSVDTGSKRKDFGLRHPENGIRGHMIDHVKQLYDEYENLWLVVPNSSDRVNIKQYYLNIRSCHRALDTPIRRDA